MGICIKHNYAPIYYVIAIESFVKAQEAYIKLEHEEKENPDEKIYHLVDDIRKYAISAICFSVMALESGVNTMANISMGASFAKSIDKLDIVSKWIVIAQTALGIKLDRGSAPIQKMQAAVSARNKLVHNKITIVPDPVDDSILIPDENMRTQYIEPAYNAICAIRDCDYWLQNHWTHYHFTIGTERIIFPEAKFQKIENTWKFLGPTELY